MKRSLSGVLVLSTLLCVSVNAKAQGTGGDEIVITISGGSDVADSEESTAERLKNLVKRDAAVALKSLAERAILVDGRLYLPRSTGTSDISPRIEYLYADLYTTSIKVKTPVIEYRAAGQSETVRYYALEAFTSKSKESTQQLSFSGNIITYTKTQAPGLTEGYRVTVSNPLTISQKPKVSMQALRYPQPANLGSSTCNPNTTTLLRGLAKITVGVKRVCSGEAYNSTAKITRQGNPLFKSFELYSSGNSTQGAKFFEHLVGSIVMNGYADAGLTPPQLGFQKSDRTIIISGFKQGSLQYYVVFFNK